MGGDLKNPYAESSSASRYDRERALPPETMKLWLDAIRSSVPEGYSTETLLDLGCGTGRFSAELASLFNCSVVGVDPSAAMLAAASNLDAGRVQWRQGPAEEIPVEDESVDVVFMSQVFHHLRDPAKALAEISRVSRQEGLLIIRNATRENNEAIPVLSCFPEALAIERRRILPRARLQELVSHHGFEFISNRTIGQRFASSPHEYLDKVSARGLSSLMMIDDRAFEEGLERVRHWVRSQPPEAQVIEPVDLFTFRTSVTRGA